MALRLWELHGDGRTVTPGAVVRPEERLSWGRTAGIGMQHFAQQPLIAFITLAAILLIGIVFKGFIGRLSVFLGVLVGYLAAAVAGDRPAREP